jgi:hypothetical protein
MGKGPMPRFWSHNDYAKDKKSKFSSIVDAASVRTPEKTPQTAHLS